jgi:hypothetical protein
VVWDISVMVKSQAPLTRLISLNHKVDATLTENRFAAKISLSADDRKNVPNRDFVLLFRDEMANKPTGITKIGAGGDQAVNIQVLPDLMSTS